LSIIIIFSSCTTSPDSSRTNEELAQIVNTVTLNNITGWSRDSAGQWKSARNKIPNEYNYKDAYGKDNIVVLRVHKILYKNEYYYALEHTKKERRYRYPSLRVGEYDVDISYFYFFSESDFTVDIKKNDISNHEYYVSNFTQKWNIPFSSTSKKDLQFEFTKLLRSNIQIYTIPEFKMFTYYNLS
jgi:hypothetical protein